LFSGNMVIADLGCSSGTSALVLVSTAIEAIHSYCIQFQRQPPEVCIFLNDLPDNDFNMVIKSLVTLRKINEPIVVASVTPGSFYASLFTSGSLHLVCSSSSLHWLSKVWHFRNMMQQPVTSLFKSYNQIPYLYRLQKYWRGTISQRTTLMSMQDMKCFLWSMRLMHNSLRMISHIS
jgi:hypothetical protein